MLQTISSLEKDIAGLKKEIGERDETIGDKEKRIYDLKKKNQASCCCCCATVHMWGRVHIPQNHVRVLYASLLARTRRQLACIGQ